MADGQRYVQHYDKNWENNFFAFFRIRNKTICLLCGHKPSHVKKFLIERHYKNKNFNEYAKYNGKEKINLINSLKLVYEEGCNDNTNFEINNNATSSEKAVTASYAISYLIAKHSKPFTEGEFIKECLIEGVKSFGNSLILAEASISLNKKTVAARLSIFTRIVQNDFSCVEELLNFVPLHGTTIGIDIFKAVEQTLQKFNIDFSKCLTIVTDGAKAMTEALCGKAIKLCTKIVTKIINAIKGEHKFLNHRKFQSFLEEHNAIYKDIPLHSEVRWLSAGKCLEKFFAIRKEIFLFLQEMSINYDQFKSFFKDLDFFLN
ncbi:hypothetical protein ACFW04_014112 [Cataglyphis niger]